jgi:hypothetical protein
MFNRHLPDTFAATMAPATLSTKIEIGSSSSVIPLSSRESKSGIIVERHHRWVAER